MWLPPWLVLHWRSQCYLLLLTAGAVSAPVLQCYNESCRFCRQVEGFVTPPCICCCDNATAVALVQVVKAH